MEKKLLIAAHARSGTRYLGRMLPRLGIDVRHERLGPEGTVSWVYVGEGEVNGKSIEKVSFETTLHQVRHPLPTIMSSTTMSKSSRKFLIANIERELPNPNKELILFYMLTWVEWNKKIEAMASWRFQIESLSTVWTEFKERVGLPKEAKIRQMPSVAWHSRKDQYQKVPTWEELTAIDKGVTEEVREMACRYGYDT